MKPSYKIRIYNDQVNEKLIKTSNLISERIFHSISDSSSIDSIYSSFRNSNYYLVKNTVSNVVQVSTGNKILRQSINSINKLND